jgi:hypothetical protein
LFDDTEKQIARQNISTSRTPDSNNNLQKGHISHRAEEIYMKRFSDYESGLYLHTFYFSGNILEKRPSLFVPESLDLWALSVVPNSTYLENTTFRKLHLFPSSGEERDRSTLLGPLE